MRRDELEQQLLAGLQKAVLTPEAIEYAVDSLLRAERERRDQQGEKRREATARKQQLESELRRLGEAIAASGGSKVLLGLLQEKESELKALEAHLPTGREKTAVDRESLRRFVQERLQDLPQLLRKDVALSRAELARHVDVIKLSPRQEKGQRFYVAEGKWDLLGLAQEDPWYLRMVAGAGFEPATFGL